MAKIRFISIYNCGRPVNRTCAMTYNDQYVPEGPWITEGNTPVCGNYIPVGAKLEIRKEVPYTWSLEPDLKGDTYAKVIVMCPEISCTWYRERKI